MGYHDQLQSEINRLLDSLTSRKQQWSAIWIAHRICEGHKAGLSEFAHDQEHVEFWRYSGYKTTRKMVTETINRRAGGDSSVQIQTTLPGFIQLQEYYVVKREGVEVGIHRDFLTDDELEERADFYEKMGHACVSHATEIRRFKRLRREGEAA